MMFPSVVALAVAATAVLSYEAVPTEVKEWGSQDLWIYSSSWYGEQCSCMCAALCWYPTPYMIDNLVAGRMFAVYNNATPQMMFLEDGRPSAPAAASVPCSKTPTTFSKEAIDRVGREALMKYFPYQFTKSATDMWDATAPNPSAVVPIFDQPCAGALEADYLNSAVQITKYIGTPRAITDNIGKVVKKKVIVDAFAALGLDAILQCRGDALYEVFTCWGKNKPFVYQQQPWEAQYGPATPIKCPPAVVATSNCYNDTVSITKFKIRNVTAA
ncbi:hypothetical protein DYB32_005148 [Aphanomyces invadans]|uniref:Secreted protein n=1 Tax=Aphanomyces invadans TaxID=157072 RepID=A0A418AV96_9STRA|nr:hypothetical protein DYB32_005148 [Aphanomyces invadans]